MIIQIYLWIERIYEDISEKHKKYKTFLKKSQGGKGAELLKVLYNSDE